MKLFSAILSVYIMGLIILPCSDIHAENNDQITANVSITLDNHHLENCCSPFCLCDCCHSISIPFYQNFNIAPLLLLTEFKTYLPVSKYSVLSTYWRPPKV